MVNYINQVFCIYRSLNIKSYKIFLEPQIVYIEEQVFDYENQPRQECSDESNNIVEVLLKRLEQLETKIMSRIDVLQVCFVKQSQRIDEVLIGLLGTEAKSTIVEAGIEEEEEQQVENYMEEIALDETNIEEEIQVESINKRKLEDAPFTVVSNSNKRSKQEPLVVESYYEEVSVPVVCQMVSVERSNELDLDVVQKFYVPPNQMNFKPTNTFLTRFPLTNIDELRKFNKSLQQQLPADEFVQFMKRSLTTDDPNEIPEQILRAVISDQILIESTWASKSSGKLRLLNLTNFLKCCLRLGFFYSNTFNLDLIRTKTIELLHAIRVENGLAPRQLVKKQKAR